MQGAFLSDLKLSNSLSDRLTYSIKKVYNSLKI